MIIGLLYFACLFGIGGAAFALMYKNIQSISEMNKPIVTRRHPEAPEPGSPQPGQPGQTPGGQTPGGTGGGGQV